MAEMHYHGLGKLTRKSYLEVVRGDFEGWCAVYTRPKEWTLLPICQEVSPVGLENNRGRNCAYQCMDTCIYHRLLGRHAAKKAMHGVEPLRTAITQ